MSEGRIEYRVLGPLEVRREGKVVELTRPKLRALLALLLLDAERVVPRDRLIDSLWGENPPATVGTALHSLVSQLRKALGPGAVLTRPPGYVLRLEGASLDLLLFDDLRRRGRKALDRGDCHLGADLLGEALDLWRGEPLVDCMLAEVVRAPLITQLEQRRLAVVEDRFDAALAAGRHPEVVGDLERAVAEYTTRERLRGQLMVALYRCGRQSEALSVYRAGHRAMVETLGITPSPALKALERAILEHDPVLELAAARSAPKRTQPGSGRRRVLGGVGILLAALLAVILVWSRPGSSPHAASPPPATNIDRSAPPLPAQGLAVVNTAEAEVINTVPTPPDLGAGAAGGGYAWLACRRGVLKLDRVYGTIEGTIPIRGGATAAVYARRRLWVMPYTRASYHTNVLLEVDPRTHAIQRIRVPHAFDTVYAGDGFVWVPGERRIARIDPSTGHVDGAIPFGLVQTNLFGAVTFTRHALWIAKASNPHLRELLRINPRTLRVTRHVRIPTPPIGVSYLVAAGAGRIWVGAPGGPVIDEYDPTKRRFSGVIPVAGLGWMAGSPGAVWFNTSDQPTIIHAADATATSRPSVQLPASPLGFQVIGSLLYAGFAR